MKDYSYDSLEDLHTPGSRGRSPYSRLTPALLPVYTPSPKHGKRKKKLAGFARTCLTVSLYIAVAVCLIAAGYVMANSGLTLTVNIERRNKRTYDDPNMAAATLVKADPGSLHQQELLQQQTTATINHREASEQLLEQQKQQQKQQQPHVTNLASDHSTDQQMSPHEDPHPELPSLYQTSLSALNIEGREVRLADLDGLVTLIVNVASACGYTESNYVELERVYKRYRDYGLEVLAFPCNEFGEQEPKLNFEIAQEIKERFNTTFTMMSKIKNIQRHPIFNFLRENAPPLPSHDSNEEISWNFNKFLVNKHGHVIKRYPPEIVTHQLEIDVYRALVEE